MHITTEYARDVVNGKYPVGKYERLACERHLRDLGRVGDDDFPFIFDADRADRVLGWFQQCTKHVKGIYSGEYIQLLPYQIFFLGEIFGWVNKDTGRRRFKKAYIKIARGNAKSAIMSGIALFGMCSDCYWIPGDKSDVRFENNPQIECVAVDREQAKIVWGDAQSMAYGSSDILKRLNVLKGTIKHKTRNGHLRALSKDSKNKDGLSPTMVVVDEYHCHKTSEVHDVVWSAFGKRAQSLMVIITTAGIDAQNSPCIIEEETVKKILNREIDIDWYFGISFEPDEGDDPHEESTWYKSNPMIRTENEYTKGLKEQIHNEYELAYGSNDPSKIREFLTKRLNIWQTDSEAKYMSGCMDKYKALAVTRSEFLEIVRDREVWAGVDLSKCRDLTAVGYVFRLDDGRYAVSAHGFMPTERATEHEHSDRVPYKAWAKDGWVELTPGAVTRTDYVQRYIEGKDHCGKLKEICYDPYSAWEFASSMEGRGHVCVEIRQGVQSLSEATKKFRDLVLEGKIVHDGNPLLTWCLSNALEVVDNNGNIKLSKKHKDDSQRIDAIAAIINAMTRAYVPDKVSIYESRGMRTI